MTRKQALLIPDLDIEVTDLIEDAFYLKMAIDGRISEKEGQKAAARIHKSHKDSEQLTDALNTADEMIHNLECYGVACLAWCED